MSLLLLFNEPTAAGFNASGTTAQAQSAAATASLTVTGAANTSQGQTAAATATQSVSATASTAQAQRVNATTAQSVSATGVTSQGQSVTAAATSAAVVTGLASTSQGQSALAAATVGQAIPATGGGWDSAYQAGYGHKHKLTRSKKELLAEPLIAALVQALPEVSAKALQYTALSEAATSYISRIKALAADGSVEAAIAVIGEQQAQQAMQRVIAQAKKQREQEDEDDEECLMLMY